jgi:two-component system, OmpR family, KDP operon response regulator KdpE
MKVLVVDDESAILATMAPLLRSRGYEVLTSMTGRAALETVAEQEPDLVVLDLGLPDGDGIDVCRRIRATRPIPIIVLSARAAEADKVAALDAGADDYVTKPFGGEELLARIRVALRRIDAPKSSPRDQLAVRDLVIDRARNRVFRKGQEIRLTPKELALLILLAQHAGRVLTHRTILKGIWGPGSVDQPEHLRVLVGALRKKLEVDPVRPTYVITEPWVGYRFAEESPAHQG